MVTASLTTTNNASAVFVDDGADSNGDRINGNDAAGTAPIAIRSTTTGITTVLASTVIPVNDNTITRTTNGTRRT